MALHSGDSPSPVPAAPAADHDREALEAAWRAWQGALARLVAEEERHWAVLAAEAWPDREVVAVLDALHAEERRAYTRYRAMLSVPDQDRSG